MENKIDLKIDIILLAAGNSSRFHRNDGKEGERRNKLFYELEGKMLYEHMIGKALWVKEQLPQQVDEICVVTQFAEIIEYCKRRGITAIYNCHSEYGISHSIELALDGRKNACVFGVCDQPFLRKETLKGFVQGFLQSDCITGAVTFANMIGNPTAFRPELFWELQQLQGDRGGKKVLLEHRDALFCFEAREAEELEDLDS